MKETFIIAVSIIGAALLWLLSVFGAKQKGKSEGRQIEKDKQEQAAAKSEISKLEAEKNVKKQSEEISQKIDSDISAFPPGGANDWLRQNANRDGE